MADLWDEQLVEEIRKMEILYNIRLHGFKDINAKENAWRKIADKLGKPVDVVQKRWKSLRDRYTREKKKQKKPNGSGNDDVDEIKWELSDQMSFIAPYIKHRATSSNVPATQEGNVVELPQDTSPTTADHDTSLSSEKSSVTTGENLEEIDPSEESLTSTSSKTSTVGHTVNYPNINRRKRSRFQSSDPIEIELMKSLAGLQSQIVPPVAQELTEEEHFAKSVASNLTRLPLRLRSLAKLRIQEVLCQLEFSDQVDISPPTGGNYGPPHAPPVWPPNNIC